MVTIKRFVTPFPGIGRRQDGTYPEIEPPLEYLKTWGQNARDGFYPLGISGQWHGGIHFDDGTGKQFYQDGGIRCIADGEVIAYRYDLELPYSMYDEGAKKGEYSTGFVLVRHRLQLPANLMQPPNNGNAPTAAAPAATAAPPEATLYSLYMHLMHVKNYQNLVSLKRPSFWEPYPDRWQVGAKAKDNQPPQTWAPTDTTVLAISIGRKGTNLRRRDNRRTVAWLPCGGQLTLGEGTGDWRPVSSVGPENSADIWTPLWRDPAARDIPLNQLEVHLPSLEKVLEPPKTTGSVVVLDNPKPIALGELIGHPGNYLRHADVANRQSTRLLLHLELFGAAPDVRNFITTCRGYERNAPKKDKTLLKIGQGATLVRPTAPSSFEPTNNVAFMLAEDSPKEGEWVKLKKGTLEIRPRTEYTGYNTTKQTYAGEKLFYAAVHGSDDNNLIPATKFDKEATAAQKQSHSKRCVFISGAQSLWFYRREYEYNLRLPQNNNINGIITFHRDVLSVFSWPEFPLKTGQNTTPLPNKAVRIISIRDGSRIISSAADDKETRWWEVRYAADNEDGSIAGWACETGHDKVELTTPWAWPGFEFVDEDSSRPIDHQELLFKKEYRPQTPLLTALFDAIDQDRNKKLSLDEIHSVWKKPQLAQPLSRLAIRHQSEWGMDMSLWDALDRYMKNPRSSGRGEKIPVGVNYEKIWDEEKKRMRKLQFFNEVKGRHGFPQGIVMDHLHPLAVIENFVDAFTKKIKLTRDHLKRIFTQANSPDKIAAIDIIVNDIKLNFEKYKLDTPLRLSHFFAQIREEAGAGLRLVENLDYRPTWWTAPDGSQKKGLIQIFVYYTNHPDEAYVDGNYNGSPANQDAIANKAYGNRTDLGNLGIASGDGLRFKGRGLKMLTGRENYTSFNDEYQVVFGDVSPDFLTNSELLAQPIYGLHSGVFFWLKHKLYEKADVGPTDTAVNSITQKINYHTDSYAARRTHFHNIWNAQLFDDVFD